MSFDEESKAIYDAVAPRYPETHYAGLIEQIDLLIPGSGPLPDRYRRYREKFIVPKDKIDDVLQAAIRECRRRTLEYIDLPKSESLRVEYVSDKPWSGYNWYQGDSRSLIQINTDLPFYIDKAVAAASHEGYPGHHVYNLLVERDFYRKNHWVEFAVCPLYSPLALFMEGSAEFGVDLLFPRGDRVTFETQTLFPLAGFDPATAETYFRIRDLIGQLDFAYTEAARRFLDNELDREKTVAWLMRFHLESREEAEKSCDFFKAYGAYTITYSVGKKVLADYVRGADDEQPDPKARWKRYVDLISAPRVPSKLIQSIHEKN
jgi:hypothetical protein